MAARWYVLHVYSGFEAKVAESIRDKAKKQGLEERIEDILIPTEEVVEIKRGQRVNTEQKIFPGYVLAKMDLSDDVWHMVKNTPKVTGFLGAGNRPSPVSEKEAARLMTQLKEGIEKPRAAITFDIGEKVKVMEGPFASFEGMVEEIDDVRGRVKVSVSIFGRATPVELEFGQVEKV
ncbi:MAG: transcription termination/antitermination protein NusG [Alphaproteobacteria bacterium]|jgi:transcriptional antiterminator NusG|nr:transcription termination/antitermination protein NusG [Alphaproteobacteria bacterium]MCB1550635.1 transcription termination/antitermination protein NusG [Alphaproteobacteria bacterium]MCB9985947.1 transcription termination/antitermination protein NusG [Micavibrio sp.]HPQ50211.1 transcription termination/antitermination protein NusG [Alphaproteobacteria bacterium]HRK96898.1 transcription termination/antitermination protein NusG [Alphaproteobacteria bacterium]